MTRALGTSARRRSVMVARSFPARASFAASSAMKPSAIEVLRESTTSIAFSSMPLAAIKAGQRARFVRLRAPKLGTPITAMSLPGQIALSSRLNSRLSQALILGGLIGFQALDSLTTHLGLALEHQELNRLMAPIMATRGELVAYAVKGTALAVLLAVLMLMHRRQPRVWQAYLVAGWLSGAAVVANLVQLLL